ncbi:hypothetical protein M422DRAFT_241173 [Sphaerobolus stellatus SS14]|nr:hypothetical protein M422DRAFT_241173 [Sphaerobolus stellatus SS14]
MAGPYNLFVLFYLCIALSVAALPLSFPLPSHSMKWQAVTENTIRRSTSPDGNEPGIEHAINSSGNMQANDGLSNRRATKVFSRRSFKNSPQADGRVTLITFIGDGTPGGKHH